VVGGSYLGRVTSLETRPAKDGGEDDHISAEQWRQILRSNSQHGNGDAHPAGHEAVGGHGSRRLSRVDIREEVRPREDGLLCGCACTLDLRVVVCAGG
jgi:hypothetical protein